MEFTFKVSEAEYVTAWKIRNKGRPGSQLRRVFFWIFNLTGLSDFQRNELRSILATALPKN